MSLSGSICLNDTDMDMVMVMRERPPRVGRVLFFKINTLFLVTADICIFFMINHSIQVNYEDFALTF